MAANEKLSRVVKTIAERFVLLIARDDRQAAEIGLKVGEVYLGEDSQLHVRTA